MNKYDSIGYYEYGEVARHPIREQTLVKHWLTINRAMLIDNMYRVVYYKGNFLVPQSYQVRQIDTNEYISKVKLVKYF